MKKTLFMVLLAAVLVHSSPGLAGITLPSDPDIFVCPNAKLMNAPYQDPDFGAVNASFSYNYGSAPYDTPPLQGTDGKSALFLDKLLVLDESEGCAVCVDFFGIEFFCVCPNGPWGNWHSATYPLKNDPLCDSKSGAELLVCQNQMMNTASVCVGGSVGYSCSEPLANKSHISGPFLSDTEQCEWWDVDGGAGATPVGPQYVDYSNLILWDWDDWAPYGVYADAVWIDMWEGDEWLGNNQLLANFVVAKDAGPTQFWVTHMKGWLGNGNTDTADMDAYMLIARYLLD